MGKALILDTPRSSCDILRELRIDLRKFGLISFHNETALIVAMTPVGSDDGIYSH